MCDAQKGNLADTEKLKESAHFLVYNAYEGDKVAWKGFNSGGNPESPV